MPPVSQQQRKLFRAVAGSPAVQKSTGIPLSVANKFNAADPGGKLPKTVKPKRKRPSRGFGPDVPFYSGPGGAFK